MVLFEKLKRKTFITIIVVVFVSAPAAWTLLRPYQQNRVLSMFDQNADSLRTGYQSRQALVTVGSGGWSGKGYGKGTQVRGKYLPEAHTDFVFAHLSEEHGFVGGATVIFLYFLLVLCALRAASRARDRFSAGVAVGVGALIYWQVLINIGMVLNVLPVTGVTLPLLSYGRTSVVTVLMAIGLLLNIEMHRSMFQARLGKTV